MTPSVPIPTDNIYKFTCLFGLALIVVSIFSFASMYTSFLDRKVKYMEIIIPLEAKEQRSKADDDLLELNRKLIDIARVGRISVSVMRRMERPRCLISAANGTIFRVRALHSHA
jgi:hypothetical protein